MFDAVRSRLTRRSARTFERATLDDLRACYRLFLRREPDPEGWANWKDLVENHHITIQMMVDGFLNGVEFRSLQAEAATPVLVQLAGFQLYVRRNDYFIGAAIARDKAYEPHVTKAIRRLLNPGATFLDIGANIGYFTLMAASLVGPTGRVLAFEPNPHNCDLIRESLLANGSENVTVHTYAAADVEQTFTLDVGGTNTNGRLVTTADSGTIASDMLEVQAVVLDDFLGELETLDLVKLDIEGAEPRALQGMSRLLRRHRPVLVLEFAPDLIRLTSQMGPEEALAGLHALGYEVQILDRDGSTSDVVTSAEALLDVLRRSRLSHLDLLGVPATT